MNSAIPPRGSRPRKHRHLPWIILGVCFVLAAVIGALFASSSLLDKNPDDVAEDGLLTAKDKTTIMIMGVDERDDDVGRSDTLMIASLDPAKNKAALLSIPRDTRVKIKGHGFDKINAAYAYGNEKLTQDTVENFMGVNIDHYIIINTKSFKKIIDAIGGIDIDVPKRMHYEDPWDDDGGLVIDLQPGMQHMDGAKAITYVRYRDEEGDIGRIKRQQDFMKAIMDKIASPAIIPKLPTIIAEVMDSMKTDLSVRQLLEFAGTLREAQKNGLQTDMIPGKPMYIDGISYWIPDLKKLRSTIADTLGLQMNARHRAKLEDDIAEYNNSIPADAKEMPTSRLKSSEDSESRSSSKVSRERDRREVRSSDDEDTRTESRSSRRSESSSSDDSSSSGSSSRSEHRETPATASSSSGGSDTAAPTQDASTSKSRN